MTDPPARPPYKTTPWFDETSLPPGLRGSHSTSAGVWGRLVVAQGEVRLIFHDPRREVSVTPGNPAIIPPQAVHHVETTGPMRMQVEFHRHDPSTG